MATQDTQDDPDRTRQLATRAAVAARDGDDTLSPGARLGRYRIEALLGRGGMGEVYRAEQLEPVRRTVALKLLRSRRLNARHLAHFEVERQLLAQMRHPAIAQIYDADTTADGFPFFAMEYIEGSPLTRFCAEHELTLRQRIELLVRVCEGVQHAHQKGVIHRDLKPGNILVDRIDGRALPKIIDFGIATASLADAMDPREVAGTPEYMSPEQAAADQALVDTRSDVYSLGVVLYELLTGRRPGVGGETVTGNAHTLRLPSEQLSTLPPDAAGRIARVQGLSLPHMRRTLRRELDWVVLKAMRHDRADRYDSAAALADDLRRFLDGQPLQAVPARRGYVAGKFVRRHRGALLAASVALAALLGGLGLSLYGLSQARAQRVIAEQRSAELEKVAAFQQSMLQGVDIEAMGVGLADGLRRQVAQARPEDGPKLEAALAHASPPDLAREMIDRHVLTGAQQAIERDFHDEPMLSADLRESVARVRVALGMSDKAAIDFTEVADRREKRLGAADPSTLRARQEQGDALLAADQPEAARRVLEATLAHATALPDADPLRIRLELSRSEAISRLGDRRRALDLQQALHRRSVDARGERDLSSMEVLNRLASTLVDLGEIKAGRAHMERLLPMYKTLLGPEHADTLAATAQLVAMRTQSGDLEQALALQRELVGIQSRRLGREHPLTLMARGYMVNVLANMRGRAEEALSEAKAVVEARGRVLGADNPQTLRAQLSLATLYARLHRYHQTLALEQKVIAARTRVLGPRHPDTVFALVNHAGTLQNDGQHQAALALLQRVQPLAFEVLGEQHRQAQVTLMIRGDAAWDIGDQSAAFASYRELLDIRRRLLGPQHADTVRAAWEFEGILIEAGKRDEALQVSQEYIEPLLRMPPDGLGEAQRNMVSAIHEQRQEDGAVATAASH
ncbi:non-specific serine/threonine protein kinase/serine/threonine-protein kinase [Luteimonas cucumeris]|uniref:Non-specific serine/threonine protein kinase/serine/threonine-protein kinase n=1 Tax=Luteimonas cucumeris TaxID=985012 RepID=A0A562L7C3_9GAMM|nr:serine/threonine-protein kinase [Luteimonas cucumeris]TWI03533.1 non-specific serine/threonine protein kinase/serine/threonine-protein kinase [Luteimonas cucumeris]